MPGSCGRSASADGSRALTAKFVGPIPENIQAHDADADVDMTIAVTAAMQNGRSVAEQQEEGNEGMVDVAGEVPPRPRSDPVPLRPHEGTVAAKAPSFLDWMLGKGFPQVKRPLAGS